MKVIAEIFDQDIDPNLPVQTVDYHLRRAARAVLTYEGKLALIHATKDNYYKVPGGGIEDGEAIPQALAREILEEAGCNSTVTDCLGMIIEYRSKYELVQITYVYKAKVIGEPGDVHLTEKEKSEGFELKWVTLTEAKQLLESASPTDYGHKFMTLREKKIIEAYESTL